MGSECEVCLRPYDLWWNHLQSTCCEFGVRSVSYSLSPRRDTKGEIRTAARSAMSHPVERFV